MYRIVTCIELPVRVTALLKSIAGFEQQHVSYTRDFIKEKGYGANYGHGVGHGIGLDIHENIFMSPVSKEVLVENMVLTVEPGIYIPDLGGVRIEDDVIVMKDGIENLTHSPKELIVL